MIRFYAENVRCKVQLVTSSCGSEAGLFLGLVLKYANRKSLRRNNCTDEQVMQSKKYSFTGYKKQDYSVNQNVAIVT